LPKYAIAELVDGEFQTLSKGAIVRKLSTGTSLSEIQKNKEVRPTAGSSEAPIQW
jgi:hypothetical protein